ncbi:M23 family metallopeptidase [Knoellia locipacati]|uniref:murein hydrolase activator EnvC family protein n=1 Tax=Knoellia locipacati TaxID=882824 RepID=UPI0038509119
MSTRSALRRILVTLGAVGSLLPGMAPLPDSPASPDSASQRLVSVPGDTVDTVDIAALRGTWEWPLEPRARVTAPFVRPRSTYGAGHRGLDLAARPGQPVLAVDEGVVTHVGVVAGRGTVSVRHASGLRSTYEPVRGEVAVGAHVARGHVIGVVQGRTHCGGGCLHLGALHGAGYVDPRPFLGGGPVILLPLGGGP